MEVAINENWKAIEKARKGEQTTVAFIGGSITQGAGAVPINTGCYAYKTFEGFCALTGRGVQDNVQYIKAGVGVWSAGCSDAMQPAVRNMAARRRIRERGVS